MTKTSDEGCKGDGARSWADMSPEERRASLLKHAASYQASNAYRPVSKDKAPRE
jgi:hypothetical protein